MIVLVMMILMMVIMMTKNSDDNYSIHHCINNFNVNDEVKIVLILKIMKNNNVSG